MEKTICHIIDYARAIANPLAIHVFGSMAMGCRNEYSDLDMLIVTEEAIPAGEVRDLVSAYAAQFCLATDVLVYSSGQVYRAMQQPNSFLASILKTSKIVYEKA